MERCRSPVFIDQLQLVTFLCARVVRDVDRRSIVTPVDNWGMTVPVIPVAAFGTGTLFVCARHGIASSTDPSSRVFIVSAFGRCRSCVFSSQTVSTRMLSQPLGPLAHARGSLLDFHTDSGTDRTAFTTRSTASSAIGSFRTQRTCSPRGPQTLGSVGPNRATVGVPTAAARCVMPESLPM
jgi:hypothetical protein